MLPLTRMMGRLVLAFLSLSLGLTAASLALNRTKRVPQFGNFPFPGPRPEVPCRTPDLRQGVCTSLESECKQAGGTLAVSEGSCPDSYEDPFSNKKREDCCIYTVSECGSTISRNITYIQNPGFPSTYSRTGSCSYKISKSDPTVCQIRLDFEVLVLGGATGCCGATCGADSLAVRGKSGKNPPVICHTNTNQHMYVQVGSGATDQVSLDFFLSDTAGSTTSLGARLRKWDVRITQIPCGPILGGHNHQAPTDCVQYFSGSTQGYIQSYGFGSGQLLSAQNYKACIRQEKGYCGLDWHPSSRTNPASFSLLSGDKDNGVNAIGDCLESFINIPDATSLNNFNKFSELCGEAWARDGTKLSLGPLRSYTTPFTLEVFSDDTTAKVLASNVTAPASGFEMVYQQVPCGI